MLMNVSKIRIMCANYQLDCEEVSEQWDHKEWDYPLTESGLEDFDSEVKKIKDLELCDTFWLEYFCPLEDEWSERSDLPAICNSKYL